MPRFLNPTERFSELLFGLIMVMTSTGSLALSSAAGIPRRTFLLGAVGCNLAWAIVDAMIYLLRTIADQAHQAKRQTPHLTRQNLLAAAGVFAWAFVTTIPILLPFFFMQDLHLALRISNTIAIGLLFAAGVTFGRYANYHPLLTGLAMVALGLLIVSMTIALGG
jgi:VIT1/CCC1 family predicted Fe2+/Mn2+ transporter